YLAVAVAKSLADEERAFQAGLLARVHDAVVATDEQMQIRYWSQVAEETFGWSATEARGKDISELFGSEGEGSFRRVAVEKLLVDGSREEEVRCRRKDGSSFIADARSAVLRGACGESCGLVTSLRDITDRERAAAKLAEENRVIAAANALLELFVKETGFALYEKVLDQVLALMASRHGVFGYIDEKGDLVCPTMSRLFPSCEVERKCICYPRPAWKGLWGKALLEKRTEIRNEPSPVPEGHVPIERSIATPILFQGSVVGLLHLANKASDYTEEDRRFLDAVADRIAPVLYAWTQRELRDDERRRAEEALQRRGEELEEARAAAENERQRLEAVMEALPVGVAITDARGGSVRSNSGYEQIWGEGRPATRSVADYAGYKAWWVDSGKPVAPEEWASAQAVRLGKPVIGQLLQIQRFDGTRAFVLNSAAPVCDSSGTVVGAAVAIQDVTALKQAEKALRALGNCTRAQADAVDEAGFLDTICRIVLEDCGHALVWVGYAEEDEGKTIRPVAHAGFEEGYLETLGLTWADTERGRGPTGTAIRTGKPSACIDILNDPRFEPWRAEALKRGYASSIVLPLMAGERAFGAISIYSREPDPFSEAEQRLLAELASDVAQGIRAIRLRSAHRQAEEALKRSEERLRLAQANAAVGVWEWDPQTGKVSVAAEFAQLYGLAPGSIATYRDWSQRVHPDDLANLEAARDIAIARREPFELEFRILHSSGETRWVECKGKAEHDGSGRILRVLGINIDITRRKRTESELREANERLHEVDRHKNEFMAVLSHELRNPLAPIRNSLFVLGRAAPGSEQARRALAVIDRQVGQLAHLVDDLLDVTRISCNKIQLQRQPLELNELVRRTVEDHRLLLEKNGVHLEFTPAPRPVPVQGDGNRLAQVVGNLLQNAGKFTDPGGSARVLVCADPAAGWAVVRVADTGVGIAPQMLSRLFQPFMQADTTL
ncbi:MAG: PAS domain S-box protein, partial [Deltaproteobacteria bacterium]|nr:PAS domain S-box protein [Deltaproteobacteria bacterium]